MSKTSFYDETHSIDQYTVELDFTRKKSNSTYDTDENLIRNFSFISKLTRDSIKELGAERSKSFITSQKNGPVIDAWKIQPPDFRYSQFDPKPMSAKEKAKLKQAQVKNMLTKDKPKSAPVLALHARNILIQNTEEINKNEADFQRTFRPIQPQEDRILKLRHCITKTGPYRDPKDHDFRQYLPLAALGLPEFVAAKESDHIVFQRELLKYQSKCLVSSGFIYFYNIFIFKYHEVRIKLKKQSLEVLNLVHN
jgi:hypothetical protein